MEMINRNKSFFMLLVLSLLFFIIKGMRYFLIGSYVPLVLILVIALGLCSWFLKEKKYFKIVIKIWSILLILWSVARLIITIMFYFSPGLTETHIQEQMNFPQFLLSLIVLISGVYLWKNITKVYPVKD